MFINRTLKCWFNKVDNFFNFFLQCLHRLCSKRTETTQTHVEVFVLVVKRSDKQQRHSNTNTTLLFEPGPLLDEAHEGGDSRARADHDHRVGGFEGQAELGLADEHGNGGLAAVVRDQFVLQPVGGDSLVGTAGRGLVLHHHGADVDAVGVNLQNAAEFTNGPLLLFLHPSKTFVRLCGWRPCSACRSANYL